MEFNITELFGLILQDPSKYILGNVASELRRQGKVQRACLRSEDFPLVFFSSHFSLQYLSPNVADKYKYHELGNQHGDNARYVHCSFSRSVTDNCKRLKAWTAFVMSNFNELLSFEREMK